MADYYEKALYNHILGQQDPETGMLCYFLPLSAGAYKVYSNPEKSFWCCVGSGFESNAKYAEGIYYHDSSDVYVNLFIPSVLEWRDRGLALVQETDFPEDDKLTVTVTEAPDSETGIFLRYPSWSGIPEITVNGRKIRIDGENGSFIRISRKWKAGDRISARFPMSLRLEYTPDNPHKAAVCYGPVVLAGQAGKDNMQAPAPFSNPDKYNDYYTYDYNIPESLDTSLPIDTGNPGLGLRKVSGLTFESKDGKILKPLYDTHHQRYIVYWDIVEDQAL